jgi:hypothetical protein
MDVNEHERLSNFTLKHKFYCCSTFQYHSSGYNNKHTLYPRLNFKHCILEINSIHQVTPKQQRCPDATFIDRSNEYNSTVD